MSCQLLDKIRSRVYSVSSEWTKDKTMTVHEVIRLRDWIDAHLPGARTRLTRPADDQGRWLKRGFGLWVRYSNLLILFDDEDEATRRLEAMFPDPLEAA